MGTYKEYIESLRKKWIGVRVKYQGAEYTIVDVDHNGALHIDKPARFTKTTAVAGYMVEVIKPV